MTDEVRGPLETVELGIMVRWLAHQIDEIAQHPQDPDHEPALLFGLTDARRLLGQLRFDLEVAEETDASLQTRAQPSLLTGFMRYKVAQRLGLPVTYETWDVLPGSAQPVILTIDGVARAMTFEDALQAMTEIEEDFPGFTNKFVDHAVAKGQQERSDPAHILDNMTEDQSNESGRRWRRWGRVDTDSDQRFR